MIRTFDLLNSEGQAYTLTISHRYTGFLTTAEGLGFENSPEYVRIGNSYERLTDNLNQGVISGIVQFFNPYAYQKFSAFAEFCQDKNLTLFYRTPTGLFKKDGAITKIEKSEGDDSLKVKIEFTATSLWYKEIQHTVASAVITFNSDSAIESPCCLSISGITRSGTSLSWEQNVNGKIIMSGTLNNVTISEQSTVYIRTDTNPYSIYKQTSGGNPTSLYEYSNFATKRFPFIKKGSNMITIFGSPSPSELSISGRILYETI